MHAYMRGLGLLMIAFLQTALIFGQDANNLALDATVKDQEGGKLQGVDIVVIQDGALVNKVKTRSNGRFDLLLDFDHEYIIEANRPGYVSKRMYVNTNNVPEDEQLWGYEYGGFAIDLFKNIEGVDFSILEKPVAKIYYDPNAQNFTYDKVYTKQIKQQLDELLEEYERKEKMQEQILAQKEKDYALALKDAENALSDGDLLIAKENYLAAAALKPNESAPKKKLQEIEAKINAESNAEDKYMSLLASADQLFAEKKYEKAKDLYNQASEIKPSESYPKTRAKESAKSATELKEKMEAEALLAEKDRKYNEEIDKADREFTSGNYLNSKVYYQNAIGLKPNEKYPQDQIKAADVKIAEMREAMDKEKELALLNERYNAQIAKADAAYGSNNFDNALLGYEEALKIKSGEDYPAKQIEKIQERLKEIAEKSEADKRNIEIQNSYLAAVKKGDDFFAKNQLEDAKTSYQEALDIKGGESYPKEQIGKIDRLIALEREKEEQNRLAQAEKVEFERLIAAADVKFDTKDFEQAISIYKEALVLKPNDPSVTKKIVSAEQLMIKNAKEGEYQSIIAEADKFFNQVMYSEAKEAYKKAIEIKEKDNYPRQQLAKIDQLEKDQLALMQEKERLAQREKTYSEIISKADKAFATEDYLLAVSLYKESKQHTDDFQYADSQIKIADDRYKAIVKTQEESELFAQKQAEYEKTVQKADELFRNEKFEEAITSYNLAASILTDKTYPIEQVKLIQGMMEERASQAKLLEQEKEEEERLAKQKAAYENAISMADAFMDAEDYLKAKSKYEEAQTIDPVNSYAKNQLAVIDQLLLEMRNSAEAEEQKRINYNNYLSLGDKAVLDKNWNAAREAFSSALDIFPTEKIPQARLDEIDKLEQKQLDEQREEAFAQFISKADQSFLKSELTDALALYKKALDIKSEDAYTIARIKKINELLNAEEVSEVVKEDKKRSVVEETYDEGNAKVTIRKVTIGDRTDTYKRVVHSWGGKYYFLNDQPISELVWNRDSNN